MAAPRIRKLPLKTRERGITTSIIPYFELLGKRPRGFGVWVFLIDRDYEYITDDYYKAKRQAMKIARKIGVDEIQLMPGGRLT